MDTEWWLHLQSLLPKAGNRDQPHCKHWSQSFVTAPTLPILSLVPPILCPSSWLEQELKHSQAQLILLLDLQEPPCQKYYIFTEWLEHNTTNFKETFTCFTASALLRGGCGLGFKSGWTPESHAWHCCSVSCRLTCFWSSCSRLLYTCDRKVRLRMWGLLYIPVKATGIT